MKKLILGFLLFTSIASGQTYNSVLDLINSNLANGTKITAVKHREVEIALLNFIQSNLSQSGDIKVIKANATYLANNFEVDGLGKNLRAGWAICNGNNGTDNLQGRVPIHYSADFPLGTVGGSKDAVVVEHSHSISLYSNSDFGSGRIAVGGEGIEGIIPNTDSVGVSGKNKNMQPYLATVYIMKL